MLWIMHSDVEWHWIKGGKQGTREWKIKEIDNEIQKEAYCS
jgi:hypothetical protein